MNKSLFVRMFLCICFLGGCLYSYLNLQNEITELRIKIPQLARAERTLHEENMHLLYEIEKFESPDNLMWIARQSAFSHLSFPSSNEVVMLESPELFDKKEGRVMIAAKPKHTITFASGAN